MMLATNKVSYIESLARELCAELYALNVYEVMDSCYDGHDWYENFVSEMTGTLWDDKHRKGLLADLKEMIEERDDEDVMELRKLYDKVKEVS